MTWTRLLNTLDNMTEHAKGETPKHTVLLEKDIVKLGVIARDLADAPPPDHATYIRLHAAVNRLTTALPHEKNTIRQKITGIVKRSLAQEAYQKLKKHA